jgi:hypothetical protein
VQSQIKVEQQVMQQNQRHGTQPNSCFKPPGWFWFHSSGKKFRRSGTFAGLSFSPAFVSPRVNGA